MRLVPHRLSAVRTLAGSAARAHIEARGRLSTTDEPHIAAGPVRPHLIVATGGDLAIGRNLTLGSGCGLYFAGNSSIGDDVVIGPFVFIMDFAFHVAGDVYSVPEPRSVRIGDRVAIGAWCVVLPGAQIGDDVLVAPGSVVRGAIPAGSHISGNPAATNQ
jgi:acetyltransferase-like isoleucine patch superfamily enzyme